MRRILLVRYFGYPTEWQDLGMCKRQCRRHRRPLLKCRSAKHSRTTATGHPWKWQGPVNVSCSILSFWRIWRGRGSWELERAPDAASSVRAGDLRW